MKIRRCPLCNGKAKLEGWRGFEKCFIRCEKCGCMTRLYPANQDSVAIADWNKRPVEDKMREEVAKAITELVKL